MAQHFSHEYLDDRHFLRRNIDGLGLLNRYQDCIYSICITLTSSHRFSSIRITTILDGRDREFTIVSNNKDHSHKDRKSVGELIYLLASKFKFDLLGKLDIDNAGFLHSAEITSLHNNGITKVPPTIYRGINKILRNSLKDPKCVETLFLSKFLFEPSQFWHLVNWHGRIGSNKDDVDMLWWLNISPNNIFFMKDDALVTDEGIVKEYLNKLFLSKYLLSSSDIKRFNEEYVEKTSISTFVNNSTKSNNNTDNDADIEVAPKRESKSYIVDISQKGDYIKISDAIKSASPGDKIIVKPGNYNEVIILDIPLEIIGEGKRSDIVVSFYNYNVAMIRAPMGKLSNLTLKQLGGRNMPCVLVNTGGCEIESCEITCAESNGVEITGHSQPTIKNCYIHHCLSGFFIGDESKPTLDGNKICNTRYSGVIITNYADPIIQQNKIFKSMQGGIYIYNHGAGTIFRNKIYGNNYSGIAIKDGGKPLIKQNIIAKNGRFGIEVFDGGECINVKNKLFDNKIEDINVSPNSKCSVDKKK